MAKTKIGQVSILPCGQYDSTKKYERLSVVLFEGSSYIAVKENQGQPITNTEYWFKLTEKGDKGDTYEVTEEDLEVIANRITEDANSKFNTNVSEKTTKFNNNVEAKTTEFNENVTTKTNTFNNNTTDKTTEFNNNVSAKTTNFNNNAVEKTKAFDENSAAQTNTFNQNVVNKTNEFNENSEKKIEEFNANAEKIEKELDWLKSIQDTQVATGENVYFDNAKNYPLIRLKGEGKSEQVTTQGYNLLDMTKAVTTTQNGITMTVNKNGSLTFNGTGTGGFWFALSDKNVSLKAGTYTWVLNPSYVLNSGDYSISLRDNTNTVLSSIGLDKKNIKFTLSEDKADLFFAIYIANNSYTFNNLTVYPMLLSGEYETSTIPPFEPYTGGQASPSPNYKQDIKTITEAKYKGVAENLYNYKDTKNVNDEMIVDDDGWIMATYDNTSGTATKFLNYQIKRSELIKPNTSYLLVTEIKEVSGNNCVLYLSQNQPTAQYLTQVNYEFTDIKNGDVKVTKIVSKKDMSTPINMLQTFIGVRAGGSCSITFRISVLADTNITAENFVYKPYQETTLPIDLQGNKLCELDKLLIDRKGNVAIDKNVGKVVLNGSEAIGKGGTIKRFYIEIPNSKLNISNKNIPNVLSDKLITGSMDNTATNINSITSDTSFSRIVIYLDICAEMSVDEFKVWLSENNITVYYELATPQIIELGTIENPEIFKGVNNIIVETNLGNMNVEIEYVEDLQVRISKLEQAFVAQGGI